MNLELQETLRAWDGLKAALMHLDYHRTRQTGQEMIIYEPSCRRLCYVPELGYVIVSINRYQFPEGKSIDYLKEAKAQAIFRAYVGSTVKLFFVDSDVCFGIPVVKLNTEQLVTS